MTNNQTGLINFRKMLQFSMYGIALELKQNQEAILLTEKFGDHAVINPDTFNPNRTNNYTRLIDRKAELIEFSKQIQDLLDTVKDAEIKDWASNVANYFNQNKS